MNEISPFLVMSDLNVLTFLLIGRGWSWPTSGGVGTVKFRGGCQALFCIHSFRLSLELEPGRITVAEFLRSKLIFITFTILLTFPITYCNIIPSQVRCGARRSFPVRVETEKSSSWEASLT